MTEQDHTMFASFALMGILQRIDPGNTNKAHYAAIAWEWADAMVEAQTVGSGRRVRLDALPLTPADEGGGGTTATTSDR